jgi:hypothetical protein
LTTAPGNDWGLGGFAGTDKVELGDCTWILLSGALVQLTNNKVTPNASCDRCLISLTP